VTEFWTFVGSRAHPKFDAARPAPKSQFTIDINLWCPSQKFFRLFNMDNTSSGIYELLIFGAMITFVLACQPLYAQHR